MPAKNDDLIEVPFPKAGIDVSGEFGVQRPNTTPFAENVRTNDTLLSRDRGGSRPGLEKYPAQQIPEGADLIQHLFQLVRYDADYLLTLFEDYQAGDILDVSSSNFPDGNPPGSVPTGMGIRNPGRSIPPRGSGVQPYKLKRQTRRVALVATPTTQTNGTSVGLAATVTTVQGGAPVSGVTVTLSTMPMEDEEGNALDGNGDSAVTNGSGVATFTVNEATYEGRVRYIAAHEYQAASGKQVTVRGTAQVLWAPDYTLALVSTDGLVLNADGVRHPLVATLTRTADGSVVVGRTVKLATSPTNRVGHRARGITNGSGQVTAPVSDMVVESVDYVATMLMKTPGGLELITSNTVTIPWGGALCTSCNAGITQGGVVVLAPAGTEAVYWWTTYTVTTTSGGSCEISTNVTHLELVITIVEGFGRDCSDVGTEAVLAGLGIATQDVNTITCDQVPSLTQVEEDDLVAAYQIENDAFNAALAADPC